MISFRLVKPTWSASLLMTASLVCFSFGNAHAATLYTSGFEPSSITSGSLAGQDGWSTIGTSSVATVQSTLADNGTQAVRLTGAVNTQSGVYHTDPTAASVVDLSANIYLATGSTASGWQFAALSSGLSALTGGIDITTLGRINLITPGYKDVGAFTRDTWHTIDFVFNYTTQTYRFSLDGVSLASNVAFCGDSGPCTGMNPVAAYSIGLFDTFGNGTDAGYLDNFSVSAVAATPAAIPEPTAVLLMGLGLSSLALVGKRLRK